MREGSVEELAERDLALIEALQVNPRAPWSAVAAATGTAAGTASRRWSQLLAQGSVWVTGAPGVSVWNAQCVAYVSLTCRPGATVQVAQTLAQDAHALSVELTAGTADLFVTVAAADLLRLSRYLLARLDLIPGITSRQTRIATHLYRDGSHWRLGALAQGATTALAARADDAPATGSLLPLSPADRRLLVQLGLDGRSTYPALAAAAGVSEATARRRTGQLLATGAVLLRAEVAAPLAGWPVPVILLLDAPTRTLPETARAVARLRQVRLCATLAGTPPLVVAAWLHDLEGIHLLETTLARAIPGLTVLERLVTLRSVKRMGRLLDEQGRAVGAVPMDVWSDPSNPC